MESRIPSTSAKYDLKIGSTDRGTSRPKQLENPTRSRWCIQENSQVINLWRHFRPEICNSSKNDRSRWSWNRCRQSWKYQEMIDISYDRKTVPILIYTFKKYSGVSGNWWEPVALLRSHAQFCELRSEKKKQGFERHVHTNGKPALFYSFFSGKLWSFLYFFRSCDRSILSDKNQKI